MDELNEIFNIAEIIDSRISSDFHGETGNEMQMEDNT